MGVQIGAREEQGFCGWSPVSGGKYIGDESKLLGREASCRRPGRF